jgi:hypothetical protein
VCVCLCVCVWREREIWGNRVEGERERGRESFLYAVDAASGLHLAGSGGR